MNIPRFFLIGLIPFLLCRPGPAQHCAPITESYLSLISVKPTKDGIKIRCEYSKRGGRQKEKYQAYLLAYLDRNAARVPGNAPKDLVDPESVVILHTQLIEKNKDCGYGLDFEIKGDDLARMMIKQGRLSEKDRSSNVGFGQYRDRIRLAVFVPFLDDSKYSVIKGLPEDKHECNYGRERALLFQQLPYAFSIAYFEPTRFHLEINGDKPAKSEK